jgi:hypothetical protein
VTRLLASIVVATAFLAACGGDSPPVSERGASDLEANVTAVKAAVGAHDADDAARALASLRATVARLRHRGDVSTERAAAILAAATDVEHQLVTITTTTTTTTTTVPPPPQRGKGEDHPGKDEGDGKDKG